MRRHCSRLLLTAALVAFATSGCSIKAQGGIKAGGGDPPPPPPKAAPAPAAPAPAKPAPNKVYKAGAIELPYPIQFETGTATLKPEADAPLAVVKTYMDGNEKITVMRVEGHTDTQGGDADNQKLSQDRANAVAKWLVEKGVDCKRLVPAGFGETKLLKKPEAGAEDMAINRRVVFVNAEVKGKAVMGMPLDGSAPTSADACKL
jgi:OmpA-OmpF porin, OOP family